MNEKPNGGKTLWEWVTRSAIIVVATAGVSHEIRLAKMETWSQNTERDRFRRSDALEMQAEILAQLPRDTWLRDELLEIKELLKDMDARLREVERKP